MRELLYIYNPRAGRELLLTHLAETLDFFTKHGFLVTAYPTQGNYDFSALRDYVLQRPDMPIVYGGGDGMLNAAVNFQLQLNRRQLISYLPTGTTNDFARSIGISTDYNQALVNTLEGKPHQVDIGLLALPSASAQISSRHFVYIAAFGAFTDVSYTAPQDAKNALGYLAYVLEGAKKLAEFKIHRLKIRALCPPENTALPNQQALENAQTSISALPEPVYLESDFMLGMITNSFSVAGFRNLVASDISLTDGLFEVILIKRPQNLMDINRIIAALLSGKINTPDIVSFKTSRLQLESQDALSWTLDGEYGGSGTIAKIDVLKQKVGIRC